MSNYLTRNKYLTAEEQQGLKRTLKTDRDSLLVNLALSTGARANELLALTKDSIYRLEGCYVVFIKGLKNSNDREVPIPDELAKELLALDTQRLFDIQYSRLDQIWDKFKPNGKKFHSLRHTFAVNLYSKTRDIMLVKTALGHRSINSTLVYAALIDGVDKLRAALIK